jgi:hypothetical protein
MNIVGLDIGGANLKAAHVDGVAESLPFPIWKHPEQLSNQLEQLLSRFENVDALAVTMTAELADCFESKSAGVDFVLASVEKVAAGRPVIVWQTGAEFVTVEVAQQIPLLVAAANWHALATWVGRIVPTGSSLLIDIGSTTTDIIPLFDGVPVPTGLTDLDRLQSNELVYSGVLRTPLSALAQSVPFRDQTCSIAAEYFATTQDIYLIRGNLEESEENNETANGKPATVHHAKMRLARMLCADHTEISDDELTQLAHFFSETQRRIVSDAIKSVLSRLESNCQAVLFSGVGTFLGQKSVAAVPRLDGAQSHFLSDILTPESSIAACAFACARLAAERVEFRI